MINWNKLCNHELWILWNKKWITSSVIYDFLESGVTSKFIDELVDETLPYADNVLPAEVILVFILAGIEALRLFFGKYIKR